MLFPSNMISPSVIWYFGCPIIVYDNVDLPDPFGPMTAWTSPCLIVRSIPFKISLPSTATWRFLISKVFIVQHHSFCHVQLARCRRTVNYFFARTLHLALFLRLKRA